MVVAYLDAVDVHASGPELHEIESAEHCGILILFAALQADLLALQLVCELRHLRPCEPYAAPFAHGRNDRYDDRGGAA